MAMTTSRGERALLLTKVEALNRQDTKLFSTILEHVGPLAQWPKHTLTQMMSTHLTCQSRLQLTLFLLGNCCPPDLYAEWLISRNSLRDKSARMQIADLIKNHKAGQLSRYKAYHLPCRVTVPNAELTNEKKKEMFASGAFLVPHGSGDPLPFGAKAYNYLFPVETPNHSFMAFEGWRWDKAYALLAQYNPGSLPMSVSMPQIKITPIRDPDEVEEDDGMYMDTEPLVECIQKKARTDAGPSVL